MAFVEVNNIFVDTDSKHILNGVSLSINSRETHVLMGPNGAGKSTLGLTLMGDKKYKVTSGDILMAGSNITQLPTQDRARQGMFMSFQEPEEVEGISLEEFIRAGIRATSTKGIDIWEFEKKLDKNMALLQMDKSYAKRDLNVGFSGGEKKKSEILQMLMLEPRFIILDETDSGLDVDAVKVVAEAIKQYQKEKSACVLIITHNQRLTDALGVTKTHIMVKGKIVASGAYDLAQKVYENGFDDFIQ